jgi:hypothetical protein
MTAWDILLILFQVFFAIYLQKWVGGRWKDIYFNEQKLKNPTKTIFFWWFEIEFKKILKFYLGLSSFEKFKKQKVGLPGFAR